MRVAVVGAGPAGCSAARVLARAGASVTLYEKSEWPRSKACGDGLTPASLRELESGGIDVDAWASFGKTIVSGPGERLFSASWPRDQADGTTMVRRDFDALLVDRAIAAGARFESETSVTACHQQSLTVKPKGGVETAIAVDAILVAEGATGALSSSAGLPPHTHRLPAYRGYVEANGAIESAYQVHYARSISPGYMWIFPGRAGRLNVGAMAVRRTDVRALLRTWLQTSSIAATWIDARSELEEAAGGIIPVGRARRTAGSIFAIGDAAGVADPLSGEGISQAMISGRLAAESLVQTGGDITAAQRRYTQALGVFDRNNREALRMRALFGAMPGPFFWFAGRRPAFANEIIASGYFVKTDASWFGNALRAAFQPG